MDDATFSEMYDKIFANGRRDGYQDAVDELRLLAHEAYKAGDLVRERLLADLATDIRSRYDAVDAAYRQRQAEAAARLAEQS